jgi:hypothetical protein
MMKKVMLSFILLTLGLGVVAQTKYYVNQATGVNTYNGLTPATAVGLTSTGSLPNAILAAIQPGDTVFLIGEFKNLSYTSTSPVGVALDHPRFWHGQNTFRISNMNGTAGNYITFKPYNSSTILKGDGGNIFRVQNASYIKIEGFKIEGEVNNIPLSVANALQFVYILNTASSLTDPLPADLKYRDQDCISNCTAGVVVDGEIYSTLNPNNVYRPTYYDTRGLYLSDVHHIQVINNHIQLMPGGGLRVSDCEDITIKGNEINDCSRRSSGGTHGLVVTKATSTRTTDDYRVEIVGNKVHHNYNEQYSWAPDKVIITPHIDEGKGISLQRNQTTATVNWNNGRILIANNICYYNGFSGIHSNDGYRIDVINNTCYFNSYTQSITEWTGTPNPNGGNVGISIQDGTGHKIINNISVIDNNMTRSAIATNITAAGAIIVRNNIIYGNTGPLSIPQDVNIEAVQVKTKNINPQFTNPSLFNFALQSNSPAIDSADATYAPTTDFLGNTRTTPDIGAIEYIPVVLPIQLLSFDVNANKNRTVSLKWQTATEQNNDFFTIEKSKNGIDWNMLKIIKGSGNSNKFLTYSATDLQPYEGISYYRLKQTDFDGTFTYSTIKNIEISDNISDNVFYPNPTIDGIINLSKKNEEKCLIYNTFGQLIFVAEAKENKIDLSHLANGIYYLRIGNQLEKIIKHSN